MDKLDDAALLALAKALGLDTTKAKRAIETNLRDPEIQVDQDLATDFSANGTPHFFINGRRLVGAQPLENFVAIIDDALAVAREMVQKGVPRNRVYQTIFDAADAPPPPPTANVGPPPPNAPSLGPANATVVIQEFSDFQCPFCKRVLPTLEAIQKEFPKDVRIVWRNLPLDFHRNARLAANAALEARALRGESAFWKMHAAIFEHQSELSEDRLRALAESLGLDGAAVADAMRTGRHDALIDEDKTAASDAGINGTPGFVINGYLLSGAQPLGAFRRVVRRALDDARRPPLGPPPAPAAAATH
jgi:protein-disulfide isomerase